MSGKIELSFDYIDGKHVPTIKILLDPCGPDDSQAWDARDLLGKRMKELLAAPVVERQPVAEVDRLYQGYLKWTTWGQLESPRLPDGTKLYTSPPAPVAVPVEIHQMLIEMRQQFERANFVALGKLLTACLDKVKELNQ